MSPVSRLSLPIKTRFETNTRVERIVDPLPRVARSPSIWNRAFAHIFPPSILPPCWPRFFRPSNVETSINFAQLCTPLYS